jgi:CCR4-NOT transcriptional regulation complex NOT5 subunit
MTRLQVFLPETLFYIFYTMVGSVLQGYVAAELYNRKWVYHNNFRKWFTTVVSQKQNGICKCATLFKIKLFCFEMCRCK